MSARASKDLTPDHFDAADAGLRAFVASVVDVVDAGRTRADGENLDALKLVLEDGARVLTNAAERLADGPLSPQAYHELAEDCSALATALRTRAESARRADQAGQHSSDDGG